MLKRAALFVALLVACDSLPGVVIPVNDSNVVAEAGAPDAAPPFDAGPPCGLDVAFGAPKSLAALNVFNRQVSPRLTPDELTIYFAASATTTLEMYSASRSERTQDFGQPSLLGAPPNGAATTDIDNAFDPVVSPDRTDLYFSSNRAGPPQIYRASVGSAPVAITPDDGAYRLWPNLGPPDVLWFAREDFDGGAIAGLSFWNAERDGGEPHPVTIAGQTSIVLSPAPSADGSVLYFATYRDGIANPQIHRALKTGVTSYASVTPVEELSVPSAGTDGVRPGWVSPDGCRLYFAINDDLFFAEKPR